MYIHDNNCHRWAGSNPLMIELYTNKCSNEVSRMFVKEQHTRNYTYSYISTDNFVPYKNSPLLGWLGNLLPWTAEENKFPLRIFAPLGGDGTQNFAAIIKMND